MRNRWPAVDDPVTVTLKRIVFRGVHWLNGERRPAGYIVFQDHGDDVWYRNIRIREL
ncbi:MAG: hypothetical protein WD355_11155 [Balneolaceae bacterium]